MTVKKPAVKKVAAKLKKAEVKKVAAPKIGEPRQEISWREVKKAEPVAVVKAEKKPAVAAARYFEAKGGRKTAIARARVFTKGTGVVVNGKDYKDYFRTLRLQKEVEKPFEAMNITDRVSAMVKVSGGGIVSQAEAVSHGIARALVVYNGEFRKRLRKEGLLSRDPRMVERKKYGLKKARRAPQWAKR